MSAYSVAWTARNGGRGAARRSGQLLHAVGHRPPRASATGRNVLAVCGTSVLPGTAGPFDEDAQRACPKCRRIVREAGAEPVGRVETLVAVEWDDRVLVTVEGLIERLRQHAGADEAVRDVVTHVRGDGRPEHRVAIDTGLIRNTEAHGVGYRCGFVVHIEA